MRVHLHTNIDDYSAIDFPKFSNFVPRKGDVIEVKDSVRSKFKSRGLPQRLEVVAVVIREDNSQADSICVDVELWYKQVDFDLFPNTRTD